MCIEVINGMADTIAELEGKLAEREWIPCGERLPEESGSYLVTSSWGKVYTCHYYADHGTWQYNRRGLIEAWQPLPKPYREDGER